MTTNRTGMIHELFSTTNLHENARSFFVPNERDLSKTHEERSNQRIHSNSTQVERSVGVCCAISWLINKEKGRGLILTPL